MLNIVLVKVWTHVSVLSIDQPVVNESKKQYELYSQSVKYSMNNAIIIYY